MLGSDARVVEPGRDRLGLEHLPVLGLQQVRLHPVHDTGHAVADRRAAGWLRAHEDRLRVDEAGEDARSVRPSADARDHDVGSTAQQRFALRTRLVTDDALELAHHPRVRMRAHHRAEAVVRRLD